MLIINQEAHMAKLPEGRAKDAYIRIRLTEDRKKKLKEYAESTRQTMTEVLEEFIDSLTNK
jgi:predicted DNA-binding antitoxin AbrB/MazE fold protein